MTGDDPGRLDWREPLDAAARSPALAARLSASLPARPRLLDLGAGTGSLFRWLAPRIGRAQAWLLADDDDALVAEAFERTHVWARRRGWTVTSPGRAMLVHTPFGAWRLEGFGIDLAAAPAGLPLDRIDAVLCSGLLEHVSRAWLDGMLRRLRVPLLACVLPNGRYEWLPRHPADRLIAAAMRRPLPPDAEFGMSLGANATALVQRALGAAGFDVHTAPSDWRIGRGELAVMRALVQLAAERAHDVFPARRRMIADWTAVRLHQTLAARLAVRVGHRDILAVPRQPGS
ncbi:MAG: class I SAM-dependent methyltransferase [Alphaproteobacteria bacterium]|nr:class I SAM-dependent methyltransferase [Alphaproteobacteria bacterium]